MPVLSYALPVLPDAPLTRETPLKNRIFQLDRLDLGTSATRSGTLENLYFDTIARVWWTEILVTT